MIDYDLVDVDIRTLRWWRVECIIPRAMMRFHDFFWDSVTQLKSEQSTMNSRKRHNTMQFKKETQVAKILRLNKGSNKSLLSLLFYWSQFLTSEAFIWLLTKISLVFGRNDAFNWKNNILQFLIQFCPSKLKLYNWTDTNL